MKSRTAVIVAIVALSIMQAVGTNPVRAAKKKKSSYLFVWCGDIDGKASDFLAVLDAEPSSPRYGEVVASVPTGVAGSMLTWFRSAKISLFIADCPAFITPTTSHSSWPKRRRLPTCASGNRRATELPPTTSTPRPWRVPSRQTKDGFGACDSSLAVLASVSSPVASTPPVKDHKSAASLRSESPVILSEIARILLPEFNTTDFPVGSQFSIRSTHRCFACCLLPAR